MQLGAGRGQAGDAVRRIGGDAGREGSVVDETPALWGRMRGTGRAAAGWTVGRGSQTGMLRVHQVRAQTLVVVAAAVAVEHRHWLNLPRREWPTLCWREGRLWVVWTS